MKSLNRRLSSRRQQDDIVNLPANIGAALCFIGGAQRLPGRHPIMPLRRPSPSALAPIAYDRAEQGLQVRIMQRDRATRHLQGR